MGLDIDTRAQQQKWVRVSRLFVRFDSFVVESLRNNDVEVKFKTERNQKARKRILFELRQAPKTRLISHPIKPYIYSYLGRNKESTPTFLRGTQQISLSNVLYRRFLNEHV